MPGDLDTVSLDALRTASRSRLVLDGGALEPFDGRFTATRPALLGRAPGDAVQPDDGRRHRSRAGVVPERRRPPALRAAHLLGALAVIQGEQPSLARAVAFANPANWDPSDEFVAALIAGLRAQSLRAAGDRRHAARRHPASPRVDDVPDNDPVIRTLAPVAGRRSRR